MRLRRRPPIGAYGAISLLVLFGKIPCGTPHYEPEPPPGFTATADDPDPCGDPPDATWAGDEIDPELTSPEELCAAQTSVEVDGVTYTLVGRVWHEPPEDLATAEAGYYDTCRRSCIVMDLVADGSIADGLSLSVPYAVFADGAWRPSSWTSRSGSGAPSVIAEFGPEVEDGAPAVLFTHLEVPHADEPEFIAIRTDVVRAEPLDAMPPAPGGDDTPTSEPSGTPADSPS